MSWYLPSPPTPDDSIPISEEEAARLKCLGMKKTLELLKRAILILAKWAE